MDTEDYLNGKQVEQDELLETIVGISIVVTTIIAAIVFHVVRGV